jgi:hypothetical protein
MAFFYRDTVATGPKGPENELVKVDWKRLELLLRISSSQFGLTLKKSDKP